MLEWTENGCIPSVCVQDPETLPEAGGAVLWLTLDPDSLCARGATAIHLSPLLRDQQSLTAPPTTNTNISRLSDPVFSDTCKIDTKFLSLNYLGGYVEPQTSKGCVLSGLEKDKEVHIIELQAPNSSRWAAKAAEAKECTLSQFIC